MGGGVPLIPGNYTPGNVSVAPSALGGIHVSIVLGLTPQANRLPPLRGFGECLSGVDIPAIETVTDSWLLAINLGANRGLSGLSREAATDS
jgi:hypothetical protein